MVNSFVEKRDKVRMIVNVSVGDVALGLARFLCWVLVLVGMVAFVVDVVKRPSLGYVGGVVFVFLGVLGLFLFGCSVGERVR